VVRIERWGTFEHEPDPFAGRNIGFAAEVAARADEFVFFINESLRFGRKTVMSVETIVQRLWPWCELDRFASLILRHVLAITYVMPEFLADEGQEWVKQSQRMREYKINNR